MAIDHKFSNTAAKSVLELLQSKDRFLVPRFQRNYSWNTEKVNALWADIMENFEGVLDNPHNIKKHQYLLGPIVLVNHSPTEANTFDVIDGQQRLSTLTMLFCVARDIILEDIGPGGSKPDGFEKIVDLIENRRMRKRDSWKLTLNDTDREFFNEIQEYEPDEGTTQLERIKKSNKPKEAPSIKLLRKNYVFFHEKITDALHTDFGNKPVPVQVIAKMNKEQKRQLRIAHHETLIYFLTHISENNFLIQIMVSDDEDAFQIFETLNERGQTLSRSNLIKNRILNRIKDDEETQKLQSGKWNKIFDEIIAKQSDDDFIMESYYSRTSDKKSLRTEAEDAKRDGYNLKMSKKNLYKKVKGMVTDASACKKFIKELDEDAQFLSTLNDPSGYSDHESKDDIRAIKALKAKFVRAPILAAYRKWANNDKSTDYTRLVRLLVKFFFKTRVVREIHPGEIEDNVQNIVRMINRGESFDAIHKKIQSYDSHEEFMQDFKSRFMPKPSTDQAKYVLQKITIQMGTKYSDVRPIDNLTLEHILPLNHDNWQTGEFFKDGNPDNKDMDEFKPRLGNMTLLTKSINRQVSYRSFKEKKEYVDEQGNLMGYNSSELEINKKTVCNHDEWTSAIILNREKKFSELADEIWQI